MYVKLTVHWYLLLSPCPTVIVVEIFSQSQRAEGQKNSYIVWLKLLNVYNDGLQQISDRQWKRCRHGNEGDEVALFVDVGFAQSDREEKGRGPFLLLLRKMVEMYQSLLLCVE